MKQSKKIKDFSSKLIWEYDEVNFISKYRNFLNWFFLSWHFHGCFSSEVNSIASRLIAEYLTYIKEIQKELKIPNNFDLRKALDDINVFMTFMKASEAQIPKIADIKAHIEELEKLTESLAILLNTTLPIITDEFNRIHDVVYPKKCPQDIRVATQQLRYALDKLNAIRHSIQTKIGQDLNKKLIVAIDALQACLNKKGLTIIQLINFAIPIEKLTPADLDFIPSLVRMLKIFQNQYPFIINYVGKDIGGRPRNNLARNFLLRLASIIENATGKLPTAYKSSRPGGYDGTLYRLAIKCAPLFTSINLHFFYHPASVGELAIEIIPYYKNLKTYKLQPIPYGDL